MNVAYKTVADSRAYTAFFYGVQEKRPRRQRRQSSITARVNNDALSSVNVAPRH